MKATGIVRRVDSLGRVVIPKEIRHTLRIKEGSPLEIYTEKDGGVTFRKYSPLGDLQDFAGQICDSIRKNTGHIAAVSDLSDRYHLGVAALILSQGDLMGCVMMLLDENGEPLQESDQRLAQTVAEFLGKQMES